MEASGTVLYSVAPEGCESVSMCVGDGATGLAVSTTRGSVSSPGVQPFLVLCETAAESQQVVRDSNMKVKIRIF